MGYGDPGGAWLKTIWQAKAVIHPIRRMVPEQQAENRLRWAL